MNVEAGYREHMQELLGWFKADLFEESPSPVEVGPGTRAFTNPGGWTVLVSRREDRTGCSGAIVDPQGQTIYATSQLDINELDRRIP